MIALFSLSPALLLLCIIFFSFHIIGTFWDEMGPESQNFFKLYIFQFYLKEKEMKTEKERERDREKENRER